MKKNSAKFRILIVFFLILGAAGCIATRLFSIQILKHGFYQALASDQQELLQKLTPERGEIFIQEKGGIWNSLAVNRDFQTVYLVPSAVEDKNEVSSKLAQILQMEEEKILEKLKDSKDPYEPLRSKLDDATAEKIKNLNLAGVRFVSESWRWYPQGTLASHVLGFLGIRDDKKTGQYGLEGFYEEKLAGENGFLRSKKDALGRWLMLSDFSSEPAQDGVDLYLTLDQNVQYLTEQKMKNVLDKWGASSGCAIVMDPKTGAVRAMASFPNFNPNEYNKVKSVETFSNSCIQEIYEPGSVFKPIVMAAGLDTGKISPQTVFVDEGFVKIGPHIIRNAQEKTYGESTMTRVLEKSINTGVVFVQRLIGGKIFEDYIKAFGFGERCEVDLAGEAAGSLRNIDENNEVNFATAAFGQGISATPLEMAGAIAAIANQGKLMRPYLVEKTVSSNGDEEITQPQITRQAISAETANKLTGMLVSTVRNGYDKIKIKNYAVAGKTGTAQIPDEKTGKYKTDETVHSFIGYAPAYDPKFLIFLKMDSPHGIEFASESLSPVFSELTQYLLNYYEIPPEVASSAIRQ